MICDNIQRNRIYRYVELTAYTLGKTLVIIKKNLHGAGGSEIEIIQAKPLTFHSLSLRFRTELLGTRKCQFDIGPVPHCLDIIQWSKRQLIEFLADLLLRARNTIAKHNSYWRA